MHIHTRFASAPTTILGSPLDEVGSEGNLLNPTIDDNQNLTFWQFLFERYIWFTSCLYVTIVGKLISQWLVVDYRNIAWLIIIIIIIIIIVIIIIIINIVAVDIFTNVGLLFVWR